MIAHIPTTVSRQPARLVILDCDDGTVTSYERAAGLSNNVRKLARAKFPDWDRGVTVDRRSLDHFRAHPEDYQPEPEPPEPRAA